MATMATAATGTESEEETRGETTRGSQWTCTVCSVGSVEELAERPKSSTTSSFGVPEVEDEDRRAVVAGVLPARTAWATRGCRRALAELRIGTVAKSRGGLSGHGLWRAMRPWQRSGDGFGEESRRGEERGEVAVGLVHGGSRGSSLSFPLRRQMIDRGVASCGSASNANVGLGRSRSRLGAG